MITKLPTCFELISVGSYTYENVMDLICNPYFVRVHQLILSLIEDVPKKSSKTKRRFDLEVREKEFPSQYLRPANLFEMLWFAKKNPHFPFLFGGIEGSQDPILDLYMKEINLNLGVFVLQYSESLKGLTLNLEPYNKTDRTAKYVLVVVREIK